MGIAPACVTCYLSYDHLGSVRLVTNQNANVISRHDYLPLGEEIPGRHSRPIRVAYLLRARQIAQWPWQKTPTEVTRQTG